MCLRGPSIHRLEIEDLSSSPSFLAYLRYLPACASHLEQFPTPNVTFSKIASYTLGKSVVANLRFTNPIFLTKVPNLP